MKDSGICMDYINLIQGGITGQAIIILDKHGSNSIIIIGGTNMHYFHPFSLPKKFEEAIDKCKITNKAKIMLLQMEIPQEINILAAKYAKSKGKIVVLDCGGRDDPISKEFLANLDFISPNEIELSKLFGASEDKDLGSLENKCKLLHDEFPNLKILLKLGKEGCAYSDSKTFMHCPSSTKLNPDLLNDFKIVDTVGAGDCFTATFFYKYLKKVKENKLANEDIRECMVFANASAFLCITKFGAMPSMPFEKDVLDVISKYSLK